MCFVMAMLFLSLGNPRGEKKMLSVIGTEPDGNIFKNLNNMLLLLPCAFTAAFSLGYVTILVDIADEGIIKTNGMEGMTIAYIFVAFSCLGPLLFGVLYDKQKEIIIAVVMGLVALVTVLCMIVYNSDYPRILMIAALFLALACVA